MATSTVVKDGDDDIEMIDNAEIDNSDKTNVVIEIVDMGMIDNAEIDISDKTNVVIEIVDMGMIDNAEIDNSDKTNVVIKILDLMDDESESLNSSSSSKNVKCDDNKICVEENSSNHFDNSCTLVCDDNGSTDHENISTNPVSKENDIISIEDDDENAEDNDFLLLLESNDLMNKVIHKCLNMDDNKGMQSVVNKTLLPLYKNADSKFRTSESFLKLLQKILLDLKHDPSHKFSHVKRLCEELKNSKKVPFVTLTTDINKSPQDRQSERLEGRKTKSSKFCDLQKARKRKKKQISGEKTDIIDLDHSDEDKDVAIVDIKESDDGVDEVAFVEKSGDETYTANKENFNIDNDVYLEERRPGLSSEKETNESYIVDNVTNEVPKTVNFNNPPTDVVRTDDQPSTSDELTNPMEIEKRILKYKALIDELDEQEVTNNSFHSPYLKSDKYKSMIIKLYKQLCTLTGNGDITLAKQKVIRLHVSQGHSPGPVKRLERYLNSYIDKTGYTALPDFYDVLRCVKQSNIVDKLGWDRGQIMNEAMALFTQCGNALRKNRQKREYKDLMCFVQDKSLDHYDPANMDPLLLARLEENKRIAKIKENEIFERFVYLEYINSFKIAAASYNRIAPAISEPNRETLRQVGSAVTQPITDFMMPIISGTRFLSQNNTNLNQPSNTVTQSSPDNQTPPIVNQSHRNPRIHPNICHKTLMGPTSNAAWPPLITIQTLKGVSSFPIMTIIPATAENNTSQFIDKTINNIQMIADNVATLDEIDNGCKVEAIENSFQTHIDNSSTENSIITREQTYDKLEQNNLNDNNMSTKEVVENSNTEIQVKEENSNTEIQVKEENSNTEIQVKEENEIHDSNANSITNVNIINDSNVVDTDNQINKHLTTKEFVEIRETIAFTQKNSAISVEETLIKKEPEDTPCNKLKENQEAQTTSLENNVNTLITNSDLIKNINKSISSNVGIKELPKIRVRSVQELQNKTHDTIERNDIEKNENAIENLTVKKEVITKRSHEIQKLLDGLGDGYISTIFDIEDPFLVVEISSDSSDDDL